MKKENCNTLDELNKGIKMGMDSINYIIKKVKNEDFKMLLLEEYCLYDLISEKAEQLYDKYNCSKKIKTSTFMNKMMLFEGINMKLLINQTDSKIAELMITGTTMGIIEGRKLLNNKRMDHKIYKLVKVFVSIQEQMLEKIKCYL